MPALSLAVLLAAQAATCPVTPPRLPGRLAAWSQAGTAGVAATVAAAPSILPGRAVAVRLLPTASVRYAVRPGKAAPGDSHGGIAAFTVSAAGRYRVALGSAAWIDVVDANGQAVASAAHGHGPDCSGIRKIVSFDLKPGRYLLQIAGAASPEARVLVVPAD